jgi:hypothetical protein
MPGETMTPIHPTLRQLRCALGLLPLVLAACGGKGDLQPYYEGDGVRVAGLDVNSEEGNIGGGELRIRGSGFGDDPTAITVVIGSQNAHIRSVTDSEVVVEVPRGPLEGGAVDVIVGTSKGQDRLVDAYTYDMAVGTADGKDFYRDEVAYIAVTNDFFSCLGGVGWDEATALGLPCDDSFVFTGQTGIEGRGEALEFAYPRLHSLYTGYRGGFGGAHDLSWEKWSLQTPPQDLVQVDIEQHYAELRTEIKRFTLVNLDMARLLDKNTPAYGLDGEGGLIDVSPRTDREGNPLPDGLPDGRLWCADSAAMATYQFEGAEGENCNGEAYSPFPVSGSYMAPGDCAAPSARAYDLAELQFCQPDEYQNTRSYRFEPEWPVGEYFFYGARPGEESWEAEEVLDANAPARVRLAVPELGVAPTDLVLPPYTRFQGTTGFNYDALFRQSNELTPGLFAMVGLDDACADTNGDGVTTGDDVAATFAWTPSDVALSSGGDIVGGRTFVRLTMSWAGLGWIGGEGVMMKATITLPDSYNVDPTTGQSTVEVPASLIYQFPSARQDIGAGPDGFKWGDPARSDYGFILMTAERITEYAIKAPEADGGDGKGTLVFAYSTGDIGYLVYGIGPDGYASWLNPSDSGTSCGDCDDTDGDGWIDSADPDCTDGANSEDNATFGESTCNDGVDNDLDGLVDADDDACASGRDSEVNCGDGEDNDGDGWTDDDDPECQTGLAGDRGEELNELGFGDDTCNDGEDNDGDGLVDGEDESCRAADDLETNCGDDVDNDGDGYADLDDPECGDGGPGIELVVDVLTPNCDDDVDNDVDGWIDSEDPDCRASSSMERGFGSAGCNDGVDNDGHGDVDRADLSCARDGASAAEQPALRASCVDSADNDGDGFVDGNDPDCEQPPYTSERLAAWPLGSGLPVLACYNGVDDDGDGLTDAADEACAEGAAPSGWGRTEDLTAPECADSLDGDGDGWLDAADPDCATGAVELGLGAAACNDGLDNDSDLGVDAADPECADAADEDEGA